MSDLHSHPTHKRAATHCNALRHTTTLLHVNHPASCSSFLSQFRPKHTATHCNTLHHTATHYSITPRESKHPASCSTFYSCKRQKASLSDLPSHPTQDKMKHNEIECKTQHTATHYSPLLKDKRPLYPTRGGGLGSSTIFKKFNEPYAPS